MSEPVDVQKMLATLRKEIGATQSHMAEMEANHRAGIQREARLEERLTALEKAHDTAQQFTPGWEIEQRTCYAAGIQDNRDISPDISITYYTHQKEAEIVWVDEHDTEDYFHASILHLKRLDAIIQEVLKRMEAGNADL